MMIMKTTMITGMVVKVVSAMMLTMTCHPQEHDYDVDNDDDDNNDDLYQKSRARAKYQS